MISTNLFFETCSPQHQHLNFIRVGMSDTLDSIDWLTTPESIDGKSPKASVQEKTAGVKSFVAGAAALARAVELEIVSIERLVEVLVGPFLKLAKAHTAASVAVQKCSEQQTPTPPRLVNSCDTLDSLSLSWTQLVMRCLTASTCMTPKGLAASAMGVQKRTILVAALVKVNFPQVSILP